MKMSCCKLLLAAAVGVAIPCRASEANSAVTPVQKVLQLLEGILEKGKTEKHAEQVQYSAYKQFCDDTTVEKQGLIKEADEKMEVLKADIEKAASDAARLAREMAGHEEDISAWNGDVKAATDVRKIEKADYDATHQDYSESIDALQRAVAVLKKQAYDRKQASLVQVSALKDFDLIPAEAKTAIDAFLSVDQQEGVAVSAPDAHGYEFQSHGIVEMLEDLLDKFIAERTTLEKEEANTKQAYTLLVQDLTSQIGTATEDKDEKTATKAAKLQAKADAEGDLTDTTATRDADQTYLNEMSATCAQKASDFESRQQLRAEELEVINKAIEIISSGAVAGNADKHLPQLLQVKGSSLAHLRADARGQLQRKLSLFLRDMGTQLNSRLLSTLAARVADDPFQKVKKMLQDLITRLMEEANEEAEHKGWCDTELATNEQTRNEKTEAVETLHAEIDELEASIAKLTSDISDLTAAVAQLDAAVAEATKLRQDEKAKNTETIQDAAAAQSAVAQALTVLKEFYAKAAEATSLVQQQPVAPEIFDAPYTGMQSENGGVMGFLEVIETDFARLEADTKASEATAQQQYDAFMSDSAVDKAQKTTDIEHKTAKKQDESQAVTLKKADVEGTQKELDAALAYFDKLKPSCVDAGVSYEDRVARRKEEIQSLQEALRILAGQDVA